MYLAGSLDQEYSSWRDAAKDLLFSAGFQVLDPYRHQSVDLVEKSLQDLNNADLVLACASRPCWSTAMEIFRATQLEKPVVVFAPQQPMSPWLLTNSLCQVVTMTDAGEKLEHIRQIMTDLGEPCEACGTRSPLESFTCEDDTVLRLCQPCIDSIT